MNRLLVKLAITSVAFTAMTAFAGPPECVPGQVGKDSPPGKEKVSLLHCGCSEDGTYLEYKEIQVSSRSQGHKKHVAGSFDSCSSDGENYLDFVRIGSDCQLDGPDMGDEIAYCTDQVAGDQCGSEVID
jgi:hypothetical protein